MTSMKSITFIILGKHTVCITMVLEEHRSLTSQIIPANHVVQCQLPSDTWQGSAGLGQAIT